MSRRYLGHGEARAYKSATDQALDKARAQAHDYGTAMGHDLVSVDWAVADAAMRWGFALLEELAPGPRGAPPRLPLPGLPPELEPRARPNLVSEVACERCGRVVPTPLPMPKGTVVLCRTCLEGRPRVAGGPLCNCPEDGEGSGLSGPRKNGPLGA